MSNGQQHSNAFDAVVIGAGFSGLYMLHRLRELGLSARVYGIVNLLSFLDELSPQTNFFGQFPQGMG
jgi:hypothetical protein